MNIDPAHALRDARAFLAERYRTNHASDVRQVQSLCESRAALSRSHARLERSRLVLADAATALVGANVWPVLAARHVP